jgi:hypothetical protein
MIVLVDSMSIFRMKLENREPQILRGVLNSVTPTTFFCWEGRGGNDARRALYPRYKTRPPSPNNMMVALKMIRELLSHTTAWQASCDGYEADDVIAALVGQFQGQPTRIETLDGDLAALGVPTTRASKIPPKLVRLYKVFVGDASDTISGIKGFGKGAWEAADKVRLQSLLDAIMAGRGWDDPPDLGKASINWLRENEDVVRAMKTIIDPLPMTDEQVENSLRQGVDNPEARNKILQEFML